MHRRNPAAVRALAEAAAIPQELERGLAAQLGTTDVDAMQVAAGVVAVTGCAATESADAAVMRRSAAARILPGRALP
ncbi:hypothetical protein DFR70_12696 [Nocardia tenerifensis]|uniref:Uncharacterized protein n=1 Tax=Nocardia tenerifensis TaxID=228006 RepID=A0A318KAW2_9NOCA|nr:hypothetical protein DFR70_12696 [Nocardia tenerifensis]